MRKVYGVWACLNVCTLDVDVDVDGKHGCRQIVSMPVSNALDTLVSGEKPGFQTLSGGLVVLLCAEVVRQRVPDHGAVHSECSASDSG